MRAMLLIERPGSTIEEAEGAFRQSLDIARAKQAKAWELRATTNLARLWGESGRREDALSILRPVYSWFTEGFDTADLNEAKKLLDELL